MADIEKVKKGCEVCEVTNCSECPYNHGLIGCMDGLCKDALAVIEQLEKKVEDQQKRIAIMEAETPGWISVDERLPQNDEDVLVWVNGTHRDMAYRDEGVWYDEEHNHLKNITHWMPLPKPPKEGYQQ